MNIIKRTALAALAIAAINASAQELPINKSSFSNINLNYPGLEKVNKLTKIGDYNDAAKELLSYYRYRSKIKLVEYNIEDKGQYAGMPLPASIQEQADKALLHQFKPQEGYGYLDFGKNINWQYWPIKDNEIRWQLHRLYWWKSMGLAYWSSGNEKYAKEWVFQFGDWVRKNPLGLSEDNDLYVWRPLEVSERIEGLPASFNMFLYSPNFTPQFLLEFLNSYNQQADYIVHHYTKDGNHLLFEAQRIITAACFFPELKKSTEWRLSGVDTLNTEIARQVYPDGIQWELSPSYHNAMINVFLEALRTTQLAGLSNAFPESYKTKVKNMIMATINFSFPDYTYPMFGDAWRKEKSTAIKQFQSWAKAYPHDQVIRYLATDHKEGHAPDYLSHALTSGGFYTFRNGWENDATVMVLKASPPGEFHAQPDNGTFELWVKGRDFTPDAGVYVYSGDDEINKLRESYRRTCIHSTLTLDNRNMVITKAALNKWTTSKNLDILTYTNPSYTGLDHKRSVLFINRKYFIIVDQAIGTATGNLAIRFPLKEDSNPISNEQNNIFYTTYADGNNLLIKSLSGSLKEEPGKVSYDYRKEVPRPLFVFEKPKKDNQTQYFISVLYPYQGTIVPNIAITKGSTFNLATGTLDLTISINGKISTIKTQLNQ